MYEQKTKGALPIRQRQIDMQIDNHVDGQTNRYTYRWINRQIDMDGKKKRQKNRYTYSWIDRQILTVRKKDGYLKDPLRRATIKRLFPQVDGPREPLLLCLHAQVRRLGLRHTHVGDCNTRQVYFFFKLILFSDYFDKKYCFRKYI